MGSVLKILENLERARSMINFLCNQWGGATLYNDIISAARSDLVP